MDDETREGIAPFPPLPNAPHPTGSPGRPGSGSVAGLRLFTLICKNNPTFTEPPRILDVVLSSPESVANVYANRLNISRATYFYQLRELCPRWCRR